MLHFLCLVARPDRLLQCKLVSPSGIVAWHFEMAPFDWVRIGDDSDGEAADCAQWVNSTMEKNDSGDNRLLVVADEESLEDVRVINIKQRLGQCSAMNVSSDPVLPPHGFESVDDVVAYVRLVAGSQQQQQIWHHRKHVEERNCYPMLGIVASALMFAVVVKWTV